MTSFVVSFGRLSGWGAYKEKFPGTWMNLCSSGWKAGEAPGIRDNAGDRELTGC